MADPLDGPRETVAFTRNEHRRRFERAARSEGAAQAIEREPPAAARVAAVLGTLGVALGVARLARGGPPHRPRPKPRPKPRPVRVKVRVTGREKPKRPSSWRKTTQRDHPVDEGEDRRHHVSVRYAISFISQIGWKHLERIAAGKYGRGNYRTLERARKAYIRDYFNDPEHFWRGPSGPNRSKGASGEDIDEPTRREAARERERRQREQRAREREAREREREREARERERERERERRPGR